MERAFFKIGMKIASETFTLFSRFGAEAIPSFCIDDVYHLTHILKDIFFHLITGEVYEETREELNRALR